MLRRLAFVALISLVALPAHAQNPRGVARVRLSGKEVAIDYGRPTLKGRDMLAKAEIGKMWRMGADDATTLRTETDLAFGSAMVPKGSYVLSATRVSEDKWQLNLVNAQDKKPVAQVPLELVKLEDSAEMMTIELKEEKGGAAFQLRWGAAALRVSFAAK